ncbi:FAD-dependent oxidoreductase [Nocardia yunnanensis]|uniref:FAD-dependent oxidoreductase n=1 Tax=Nocardia yunnanensis TaxID=2382165 RepID=A0A386Z7T7_9NOCA|nr:FAD-dependent oxidoreductase [Nocardia yunnanensis]AYF73721.1 FAD-dependent oxidoreductase [Nocardia yunnanensis]
MTGRIVIVGAGVAGATAVRTLRAEGYTGEIVLLGAEPEPPYRRPMVSKEILAGAVEPRRTLVQPSDFWHSHDVDLRLGVTVAAIEPDPALVWLADGTALGYDSLLLATGAQPRTLALAESATFRDGSERDADGQVLTLRSRADAEVLRSALERGGSLLVVGAGLIGCEVAATARGLGAAVTVLDAGPHPVARVAPAIVGNHLRALHAEHGVAMHTDVLLTRLERAGGTVVAAAADGSTWQASVALIAIGSVPDTRLAEAAGLVVADGIWVDERYRTSAAGVYAAGDAASRFDTAAGRYRREEHWNSAQAQGAGAARSMLGLPLPADETPWGWSLQYGRNMQFAGTIGPDDELVVRGRPDAGDGTVLGLREGRAIGVVVLGRPGEFRAARDLVGRGAQVDPVACADETRPLTEQLALSGQS